MKWQWRDFEVELMVGRELLNVASVAQQYVPAGTEGFGPLGPGVKYTVEKVTFHGASEAGHYPECRGVQRYAHTHELQRAEQSLNHSGQQHKRCHKLTENVLRYTRR